MCRFVAVISKEDIDLERYLELLKVQSSEGKRGPHRDGFGFWILSDGGEHYYRTTLPAWEFAGYIPEGHIAFFHARKRGLKGAPVDISNVHPFIKDGYVFMHNGSVKIKKHPKSIGSTDSESFFLTLLEKGIEVGLNYIRDNFSFTSLNFVMWDGNKMIIFRLAKIMKNYFTIFMKEESERIIISTEGDTSWKEIGNGEMVIIHRDLSSETRCIFPDMCH
jgi:glutamine amidotransferase